MANYVVYAVLWALWYFSFVAANDHALNVLKFCIWTLAIASPLTLSGRAVKSAAKTPPDLALRVVFDSFWALNLGAMVWFGHLWTGAACAGVMAVNRVLRTLVAAEREATK